METLAGMMLAMMLSATPNAETVESPRPPVPLPPVPRPVVLLELFTSQGCSSCPPADALLSRLAADPAWSEKVAPIAFHVDYWNYIGWNDPFSRRAWSERQERYAEAFDSDRIYTPQLVVHGRHDCNGGDLACLRRALERLPVANEWQIEAIAVERRGDELEVRVRTRGMAPSASRGVPRLYAALVERGLETRVARGENAHRVLDNDNVVRDLAGGEPAPRAGESALRLRLDPRWRPTALGLVIFLQDRESMVVVTAARFPDAALAERLAGP